MLIDVYDVPARWQGPGIQFESNLSWREIQEKALATNKYILVDCYATWCGPCKFMDKEVYPLDYVGKSINEKFISVKVQMDTSANDVPSIKNWYLDASRIMKQYDVTAFPTYLFFSPDGKIVHKYKGALTGDLFVEMARASLHRETQYFTLLDQYKRGMMANTQKSKLATFAKNVGDVELAYSIAKDYIDNYLLL